MPPKTGVARFLANKDRGQYVRSHDELLEIVSANMKIFSLDRYYLHLGGANLWHMTYLSAKCK